MVNNMDPDETAPMEAYMVNRMDLDETAPIEQTD